MSLDHRFRICDARIVADGPAQLHGVLFVRCTLIWETAVVGVIHMKNCDFADCTFIINGMEVTWAEFCELTKPRE